VSIFPLNGDVKVVDPVVFFGFIRKLYVFMRGVEFLRYGINVSVLRVIYD
jgi:hypothetical protein